MSEYLDRVQEWLFHCWQMPFILVKEKIFLLALEVGFLVEEP
jgi:hypothetical protein